jgi:hypothetical protein
LRTFVVDDGANMPGDGNRQAGIIESKVVNVGGIENHEVGKLSMIVWVLMMCL